MAKNFYSSTIFKLLLLQCLSLLSTAKDFSFFYFVQQWPGSYCGTNQSCCFPTTGRPPSDFGILGLWPIYNDGNYPSNCDPKNPFDQSKISDVIGSLQKHWPSLECPTSNGTKFWSHEWEKHGTCSESVFDQHSYFQAAITLKFKVSLLDKLRSEGINPGRSYNLSSIRNAVLYTIGFDPWIECNKGTNGNSQLYKVYFCVNSSASNFVECPVFPTTAKCDSTIDFPSF